MFHSRNTSRQRGFTLLELLVVVIVILALVGILIPALSHAQKNAARAAAVAELHTIRTGLQQYYADFSVFPPSSPAAAPRNIFATMPNAGPEMLAQGLMGYMNYGLDGAGTFNPNSTDPPFGFRVRPAAMGGRIYGPYVAPDSNTYVRHTLGTDEYFVDQWGSKIMYFRSTRSVAGSSSTPATTLFGDAKSNSCLFVYTDCTPRQPANTGFLHQICPGVPVGPARPDMYLPSEGDATNRIVGPVEGASNYLLISAGPDRVPLTTKQQNNGLEPTSVDDIIMTNDN